MAHWFIKVAALSILVGCDARTEAIGAGDVNTPLSAKHFMVFDGTQYRNKPDFSAYGIKPVNILYVSRFWANWHKGVPNDELPDERVVRRLAREAKAKGNLLVLDIEHWRLHGDDAFVAANVAKYAKVMQWFREEEPGVRAAYFGMAPIEDYDRSRLGEGSFRYRGWQRENDRLRPLASVMDVLLPSIYTYYPDQQEWVKFAIENIKEARRYGKPVYVFLWPQYSERNKELAHQYLPPDYWELQLKTVRQYADGVVIWGGWDSKKGGASDWDEQAPWWRVTKKFMSELNEPARLNTNQ